MFKVAMSEISSFILHKSVDIVEIFIPPLKQAAIIWIRVEFDLLIESVSDLKNSGWTPPQPERQSYFYQ